MIYLAILLKLTSFRWKSTNEFGFFGKHVTINSCLHFDTIHAVFHQFEHHLMPVFSQKLHILKFFCSEIVFNILLLAGCGQRIERTFVDFKAEFER